MPRMMDSRGGSRKLRRTGTQHFTLNFINKDGGGVGSLALLGSAMSGIFLLLAVTGLFGK
jgi:hypothetical protein